MHAVLRIDLQTWRAAAGATFAHDFIDAGRAVPLLGRRVLLVINADGHRWILQLQMAGLIFLVMGVRQEHGREPVKGQHTIGLGIVDRRAFGRRFQLLVVGLVVQRPR